jgi:hypothetical protein
MTDDYLKLYRQVIGSDVSLRVRTSDMPKLAEPAEQDKLSLAENAA